MKLILLQHLSGAKGSFGVGEEITVSSDTVALKYIKKGIAKAKTKKEQESLLTRAKEIEEQEAQAKAKAKAILEQDKLKVELNSLYAQVVLKEAELLGVVLSDEEIVGEIEVLATRVETKEE